MNNIKKPWIHDTVIELLEKNIKKNTKLLEFGSGYSTVWFQNYTDNLISIEHNKLWYDKINPLINNKTRYILKEINYISKPTIDKTFYKTNNISELLNFDVPENYFDIILVDGIHRVNCVEGSYKHLKKGGILILDDSNRIDEPASDGSYKPIEDLLKDWKHIKCRTNYQVPGYRGRNTDYWIKPL